MEHQGETVLAGAREIIEDAEDVQTLEGLAEEEDKKTKETGARVILEKWLNPNHLLQVIKG